MPVPSIPKELLARIEERDYVRIVNHWAHFAAHNNFYALRDCSLLGLKEVNEFVSKELGAHEQADLPKNPSLDLGFEIFMECIHGVRKISTLSRALSTSIESKNEPWSYYLFYQLALTSCMCQTFLLGILPLKLPDAMGHSKRWAFVDTYSSLIDNETMGKVFLTSSFSQQDYWAIHRCLQYKTIKKLANYARTSRVSKSLNHEEANYLRNAIQYEVSADLYFGELKYIVDVDLRECTYLDQDNSGKSLQSINHFRSVLAATCTLFEDIYSTAGMQNSPVYEMVSTIRSERNLA